MSFAIDTDGRQIMPYLLMLLYSLILDGVVSNKISLSIQGSAAEMSKWIDLKTTMHAAYHVSLFLLSFDKPITDERCSSGLDIFCIYGPHTSWTAGRNLLASTVFELELQQNSRYKYWVFADHDILLSLNYCHASTS